MKKQLEHDLKGCLNRDLAAVVKDLMEKYNALLAQLDLDATVTDTDYEANHAIDID